MKTLKRTLLVGVAVFSVSAFLQVPASFAGEQSSTDTKAMMNKDTPAQRALDRTSPERVEAKIKELHDKLGVTTDQEDKWKDVADAMRTTAKDIRAKMTEREDKAKGNAMTAPEELRAYAAMAEARYDGAKRMISPFEKLYDAMTPEQKKDADELFAHPHMRAAEAGAGGRHQGHTAQAE